MSTTLALHLPILGVTQYTGYSFKGMCNFAGVALGITRDGLYKLDVGDTDNGTPITAGFALPKHDLGTPARKRIRSLRLNGSFAGDMAVSVTSDQRKTEVYAIEVAADNENIPTGLHVKCRRKETSANVFTFLFENKSGSYFCVDNIHALVILLS